MARIFNLIYVMVLFLSLFIILTNGDGKHFLKFHINLIHNISFTFYTNTCFISQLNATQTMIVEIICVHILQLESVFMIIVTVLL